MVDIFSVPVKQTINKTLFGKSISLVGLPKCGKSSVAAQAPQPIFLATENGLENLVGITPIPISSWTDFTSAVTQLCTAQAKEKFKTVVIDSMTNLLLYLEKYEGARQSTDKQSYDFASDMDFGKGNKGMKMLLGAQLQKLVNQGYLVINIVHAELKSDFTKGSTYIGTSLSNAVYGTLEKFVDETLYLSRDENKITKKIEYNTWFSPKCGFSGCGGRFMPAVESVPTSFANIEKALLDAMEASGNKQNATFTNEMKTSMVITSDYDFAALKKEFDTIVAKLMSENSENGAKIQKVVADKLGVNKKVSNLTAQQVELLNEVVVAVKEEFGIKE